MNENSPINNGEKHNGFPLARRPSSAVEKAAPGAKHILSSMVADSLALAKLVLVEQWLQQGKGFYFGYRVSKSYEKAFALFSKAAAAGHPEAQFHVGLCFEDGDGVKPDQVQATQWYLKSAINGFAKSQNNLAICYRDGQGVPMDYDEAEKWYRKAAAQGYAPASCRPGSESRGHGLTCEQLNSLKNPGAVQRMGYYYRYKFDHGAPQDGIEAIIHWHRMAAVQGSADAQTALGVCYELGHGVQQDFIEAAKWYRMAAEQDSADAQNKLVVGIQSGLIVPLDSDEEWKWYLREEKSRPVKLWRKGAERGEASDQILLGCCYEKGMGVPQDLPEAYKWFKLAAEKFADKKNSDSLEKKLSSLSSAMTSEQLQEGERRYQEFNSPHRSNAEKAAELPVSKRRGTLLIVDDEDGPRQSLRVIFKDEYDMVFAEDGVTAIRLAQENDVDVVVTDLRMAGMSGLDVLEQLKYIKPDIEVIIMTAYWTTDTIRRAFQLGASDYILQPFDLATMRAAVSKAMQRRKRESKKTVTETLPVVADADLESWYQTGQKYYLGTGVPQDNVEALKWYRLAAERGHAQALWSLGCDGSLGQDQVEALKWCHKAAELGYSWAQYELGNAYLHGKGVEKNAVEAVKWLRQAAYREPERIYRNALKELGICCQNGCGTPQDHAEAYKLFKVLAEIEDKPVADGSELLGKIVEKMNPAEIAEGERRFRKFCLENKLDWAT